MSATTPPITKRQRREQARAARLERERAAAAATARRRRLLGLGAVLAAAALVVAVAIAISGGDATKPVTSSPGARPAGAAEVGALFAGIPQRGITLGDPAAPVRVVEFADLQCPACAAFARDGLAAVVRDYVRPGQARMELRTLAFIGPDSVRGARVVQAAGRQGRLWNAADIFYLNQGAENSGFATEAFLRRIAGAVPGLDVRRMFAERGGAAVARELAAARAMATREGVQSTPTFLVGRGTDLTPVDAAGLPAAIAAALKA